MGSRKFFGKLGQHDWKSNQRITIGCLLMCWGSIFLAKAGDPFQCKVLFIPLDERPPCFQFPLKMSEIGNIEMVAPPRELLGRFTTPGQCEAIIAWIEKQPLEQFDAAIVSLDMLAYGGLVASRVADTPLDLALKRAAIIRKIRVLNPRIRIYGSSVIMRLAPTADGKNEAYREKLAKWAEISADPSQASQTQDLEKQIPSAALQNYLEARQRNLQINNYALSLLAEGGMDYLILSQDDAKPRGVHVRDRESLLQRIQEEKLESKAAVQPGADEVSMLLLARVASDHYQYRPKVKAIYASEASANKVMPYEDRSMRQTVSFHLKAVGAQEVNDEAQADLLFFVFADRFSPGLAASFAQTIQAKLEKGKKGVIIADVDPLGDVQGGDTSFTETLKKAGVFAKINGYACWNTAGNTIGTALPHGFVYGMTQFRLKQALAQKTIKPKAARQMQSAIQAKQNWFTLNRLLDDYAYHSLVRPQLQAKIRERQWNGFRLTPAQNAQVEKEGLNLLLPLAQKTAAGFYGPKNNTSFSLDQLKFVLPWGRTFEAEIDFQLKKL
jgi:Protein of unknown function (DUF4127)